ncbi:hypothetical protein JCM8547_007434 [Rhodosporidiobolus lusitaniae]
MQALALLPLVAFLPTAFAQSCPTGTSAFSVTQSGVTDEQCCSAPAVFPLEDYDCSISTYLQDGQPASQLDCYTSVNSTFSINTGTNLTKLRVEVAGASGGNTTRAAGGKARTWGYDLTVTGVNVGRSAEQYFNDDCAGGGGWTGIGDLACAQAHPAAVFPDPTDGAECRWLVGGGGGGAMGARPGAIDGASCAGSNKANKLAVLPGLAPDSNGMLPYLNTTGVCSGGGGGGGIRGGESARPPFMRNADISLSCGAGGTSGVVSGNQAKWKAWSQLLPVVSKGRARIHLFSPDIKCSAFAVDTTFATTTVEETSYIETVYTPSATITETEEVDLGPDYFTLDIDGGLTTPPTSTVHVPTDVTHTPEPTTTILIVTSDASTVYETSIATSTPPTSTFTATTTVSTGSPACSSLLLVFPAACCPSAYVKLQPQPKQRRRAVAFGKRAVNYTTQTVDGGTKTETNTVQATQRVASGEATVTSTATVEVEAPTPLETVTTTTTVTLPQPQIPVFTTIYGEADMPLVYETSTYSHEAATPVVTDTSYLAAPTTTVTVHSTTTLARPLMTTTTTVYAQSTTCSPKAAGYSQTVCPLPILAIVKLDQIAQVNMLNLYKGLNGNKPITVDCGSAGVFSY